jgi:hypothetical protein
MLAIVFVGLLISVLVVFALFTLAFLEVAFTGPRCELGLIETSRQWQPPFLQGDDLFAWAATTAKAVTTRRLADRRSREVAKQLATDIYEGATLAMTRFPNAVDQPKPNCPSCRHQMIGLTPPEAIAIADAIRTTKPEGEANGIRDRAAQNAGRVIALNREQYENSRVVCPLLASDGSCAVFDFRPLHCRGWCRSSGSDGQGCLRGDGDASQLDAHAHAIGQGAEEGLSRGLESSGLDGHVYELNSALVAAFETPTAAEQWASGAPIFGGCQRYE